VSTWLTLYLEVVPVMWSVQCVDVLDTVLGGSSSDVVGTEDSVHRTSANDVVGTVCRRG